MVQLLRDRASAGAVSATRPTSLGSARPGASLRMRSEAVIRTGRARVESVLAAVRLAEVGGGRCPRAWLGRRGRVAKFWRSHAVAPLGRGPVPWTLQQGHHARGRRALAGARDAVHARAPA